MSGSADSAYSNYYEVEVKQIDDANKTAAIRLRHRPKLPFPREPGLADLVLGGIDVDGGGVLVVGGHIVKVPPRGPERALVEQIARYLSTDLSGDVASALALRRSVLTEIVHSVIALHAEAEIVSGQPPGYKAEQGE